MTPALVSVLWGLLGFGGSGFFHPSVPDTVRTSGLEHSIEGAFQGDVLRNVSLDVPFLAQGPLLCGGAAAAMVQRFWGVRGVYGEDFGHLVWEEEGGIRASELTAALMERGYDVRVTRNEPGEGLRPPPDSLVPPPGSLSPTDPAAAALQGASAALTAGIPPIILLESGATRLHYVVLVALDEGSVWIHDPNFGPGRRLSHSELLRRWEASGYWAALATPTSAAGEGPVGRPAEPAGRTPLPGAPPSDSPPAPAISLAIQGIRAGDFAAARAAVGPLVQSEGPPAALGRRILATAWFLEGEQLRALEEWNALGEPAIDLVAISGLDHTRHQVAQGRMGLTHGVLLTPRSFGLARRRLAQIPSIQAARIDYRPLGDGSAEVEAAVLERVRVPGYGTLAVQGVRGLLNHRMEVEVGPLVAGGDRLRMSGSWEPAQRTVEGSFSAPARPFSGVVTVTVGRSRERFGVPGDAVPGGTIQNGDDSTPQTLTETRSWSALELQEWVHPHLRLGATVALETWDRRSPGMGRDPVPVDAGTPETRADPARLVSGGLTAHWATEDDHVWASARGEGWSGSGMSFGRVAVEGRAILPRGARREWRLRAGGIAASRQAPRMIWPGAGTVRIRDPLLRAHSLVEKDVIQGPAFGRELLHATAEHRVFLRVGPARLGGSVFLDAVHARSRNDAGPDRTFVDVGLGFFLDSGSDEVVLSLARGEAGWRLSVQVGG